MTLTITDSIEIRAKPGKVFECLVGYFKDKESYQAWHPEHVDLRWIKGGPLQEESIIYAEEYLHGELHKLKFMITRIVPNELIEYRALFPLSIFNPKNVFVFQPKGEDGCIFTATVSFRAGPLFKKLAKNEIKATAQHMKEEGENIKRAVESRQVKR